LIKFWID